MGTRCLESYQEFLDMKMEAEGREGGNNVRNNVGSVRHVGHEEQRGPLGALQS